MAKYRTAPTASSGMPKGIPYIVTNEAAERFSFYGMKGILVIFMTKYLMDQGGQADFMKQEEAMEYYHLFTSAVYFFPALGALLSDVILGKYRTILTLSVVYCLGHLALAMDETRMGLAIGLTLIAIGSGGIKPCVSAHVGDQFGKSNSHLMEKVFNWFYLAINLGAFVSTLLTPWLLDNYGPHLAFGVPGLLMLMATILFWMGRNVFIHIPAGGTSFIKEIFSAEGLKALGKLSIIYVFVAMFWALFDQTGSAWVLQAEKMDRNFLGFEWLSSQIQAINPVLILTLIPLFTFVVYPLANKIWPLTPLRKIAIGFFITVPAFLVPAWIELTIADGGFPNIAWQLAAYGILTTAEILISVTCLEFSYTQAPKKMKSVIMAAYLMSVSVGNIMVSQVNHFIQVPSPSFETTVPGDYELQLTASDGTVQIQDTVAVRVLPAGAQLPGEGEEAPPPADEEKQPVADAGLLQAVAPGEQVRLYATADKNGLSGSNAYSWQVRSVPDGSRIDASSLVGADTRNPTFVPDVAGAYDLEFVYEIGGKKATATTRVVASTANIAPQVDAGPDQVLVLGEDGTLTVTLDGGSSFDPDGDALTYEWRMTSAPDASGMDSADIDSRDRATAGSTLSGAAYYAFWAACMGLTAILFIPVALLYREKTYIQDEDDQEGAKTAAKAQGVDEK
ncbi:MAG: POT family MFS transporter [Alphaproteobacteria bacterium]|nr:POT family MFS transporter [Alphaproteobacteria bacterium]